MLPDRIKSLREEKKLSQDQLAKELKIGRASISNYELGLRVPDADVLVKYAVFFDTSIDYICGNSPFKRTIIDDYNKKYNEHILSKKIEESSPIIQNHCDESMAAIIDILKYNMRTGSTKPIILISHLLFKLKQFSEKCATKYGFSLQNKWNAVDYMQFDEFFDENYSMFTKEVMEDMNLIARFYKSEIRTVCGHIDPSDYDPTIMDCKNEEKESE